MIDVIKTEAISSITPSTTYTLIQIAPSANIPCEIREIGLFFGGTVSSNDPIHIELQKQNTTPGTAGSTSVGVVVDSHITSTPQTVFGTNFGANQPASDAVLWHARIHPQSGTPWRPPVSYRIKGGHKYGLAINAPHTVGVRAYVIVTE